MIHLLNSMAENWWSWQFAMVWQTAVLIGIIWMVDVCIRKWAHPQLRYALWILILIKLVIGPTWTSPVSVTSHIPGLARKVAQVHLPSESQSETQSPTGTEPMTSPTTVPPAFSRQLETASPEMPAETTVKVQSSETVPEGLNTVAGGITPGTDGQLQQSPAGAIQPVESVSLSLKGWAMFVWLGGVVILTAWLIRRLSNLRKEHLAIISGPSNCHPGLRAGIQSGPHWMPDQVRHDNSVMLPAWFNDLLAQTSARLNVKRLPRVVLTDRVACPAVFGLLRPVLLIPAAKLKHMSQQDTEHILLHELAHIKRGDLWVHAVAMTLQILYWFNPLLWLIRRPLQNLRELCCDATVAKLLKEKTPQYRETLLETARQLLAEPVDPGLGLLGLFENSNWLITRLQWLEKNTWKNRKLRIVTIIALVAVMTTCVLPMANRPKIDYAAALDNGTTVELLAVCQYPSAGKIWWQPDGSPCDINIQTKDTSQYTSEYPGYELVFRKTGNKHFEIRSIQGGNINSGLQVLEPAGLIGKRIHVKSRYQKTDIKIVSPSGRWKTVHATKSIGGSTSTEVNGKTLVLAGLVSAGSDVILSCSDELGDKDATRIIVIDAHGEELVGDIQTDSEVNGIRQRTIRFKKMDIADVVEVRFQTCPYEYYTFKNVALRAQEDSRFKVTGTVTDAKTGEPIAGADVYDDGYNDGKYRTTTDEDGNFALKTSNEEHNVAAAAEGYKTQTKVLTTAPFANHKNFNFQLTKNTELKTQNYTATLPNGVTVELLGVYDFSDPGRCWDPKGILLDEMLPFFEQEKKYVCGPGQAGFEFLVRFDGVEKGSDIHAKMNTVPNPRIYSAQMQHSEPGQEIANLTSLWMVVDQSLMSCDLDIAVAGGPWETVATAKQGDSLFMNTLEGFKEPITISPIAERDGRTVVSISHSMTDRDVRLIAVDMDGKEYPHPFQKGSVPGSFSRNFENGVSTSYQFNLPLERLDSVKLKTRPYSRITFKNVALRSGVDTKVEVVAGEGRLTNEQAVEPVGERDPERGVLMRRYEILRRKLIEAERQYESGVAGVDQVYQAKIQLFRVGSELAETPADRIDFLEHIADIYQELLKTAELRLASGRGAASEVDDIKLSILEVQQQIVQTQAQLKQIEARPRVQNVTFKKNMPLKDALDMISQMYEVNIVPSQTIVKGGHAYPVPVTNLYDVTFEELLTAVCGTSYTYAEKGGLIYVYTNAEYEGLPKRLMLEQAEQAVATFWAQKHTVEKFVPLEWGEMLDRDDGTQSLRCKQELYYWNEDKKEVAELMFFFDKTGKVNKLVNLSGTQYVDIVKTDPNEQIDFEITRQDFRPGDSIEITEVSGSSDVLEVGQTYTVKGRYTLASEDAAALHVYATNGETRSEQGPIVQRGSGEFVRTFTFVKQGKLHLSFYPAKGGNGFGGIYFVNKGATPQPEGPVDLAPAELKLHYDDNRGTYSLVVSIENTGDVTIPPHRVRYYRGDPADGLDETGHPHSGWHNAGPIEPGKTWNERTRAFNLGDGDYTFTVVLDYDKAVQETDESNNQKTIHVKVQNNHVVETTNGEALVSNLTTQSDIKEGIPQLVSVYPPEGSEMALVSQVELTFDRPMMQDQFDVVDASLGSKAKGWSEIGPVRSAVRYESETYKFIIPVFFKSNWKGSIKFEGFKSAAGVETESLTVKYSTLQQLYSVDIQKRFEEVKENPQLKDVLLKIQKASREITSLQAVILTSHNLGSLMNDKQFTIKVQGKNQFYADMS